MSALLQAPETDGEPDGNAVDRKLVAAVRGGDDRAFEELYERYHRRIHAYVFGMVKDHQRAEDVTQDIFMSAVRRMRATERPIAFKPWIYEIAKNACIDQFRRSKRAEEVSFDADEGLAPSDYGRLVSAEPVPDAALLAKQKLDDLCGAFGGLSDAHHEILVLRELEGLSYREIGERMGMSRPAVESTLFRARRRLTEEYDELASGQRCLRIQSIIAGVGTRRPPRRARHAPPGAPRRPLPAVPARGAGRGRGQRAARAPSDARARGRQDRRAAPVPAAAPRGGDGGSSWLHQLPLMGDQAAAGRQDGGRRRDRGRRPRRRLAGRARAQRGRERRRGRGQPGQAGGARVRSGGERGAAARPATLLSGRGRARGETKRSGPRSAAQAAGKGAKALTRRGAGSAAAAAARPRAGAGTTTPAGGSSGGGSPAAGSRSSSGG